MDLNDFDVDDDLRQKLNKEHSTLLQLKTQWDAILTEEDAFTSQDSRKLQESFRLSLQTFESLCSEVESDEMDQVRLFNFVARFKADYESLRRRSAQCVASSRRKEAVLIDNQRAALLSGASPAGALDRYLSETSAAAASAAASASLRRTKNILTAQVAQTGGVLSVLESGNEKLSATDDELRNRHSALQAEGRKSIVALGRQAQLERWILVASLGLFLAVAVRIGYKRAPDALKIPFKIFYSQLLRLFPFCSPKNV